MAGTFERLQIGDRFSSPIFELAADRTREVVRWAGYVHPLFSDPDFPMQAGFAGPIVPGELVLLVLGGLAEQTGVFDETTIALVEFGSVKFRKPAAVGDAVHLEMEVLDKKTSSSGRRGFVTFRWVCRNQEEDVVLEADASLAFKVG